MIFEVSIEFEDHTADLLAATRIGAEKAFAQGAAATVREAVSSIVASPWAGPAGGPICTRRGQARRGVASAANPRGAVMGFAHSVLGRSQEKNEDGLRVGKRQFPIRPTMKLALQQSLGQIAGAWAGAITH